MRCCAALRERARLRARAASAPTTRRLSIATCGWTSRRRVTLGDAEVALTAHEFDILHVLMRSPDKVFSRELLYELVWKNGYYGEQNAVNVHVSNIRKKLAAAGGAGDYIKTVWGIGFKLA